MPLHSGRTAVVHDNTEKSVGGAVLRFVWQDEAETDADRA